MLNPLSQDYLSFNMEIIQNAIKTYNEVLNLNGFIFYLLLNFYDEIFMLLCFSICERI